MDINKCPICIDHPKDDEKWETNWIQCSVCSQWFHIDCLSMTLHESNLINQYHCESCSSVHGASVLKRHTRRNVNKIDYVSLNAGEELQYKDKHNHIQKFQSFENDRPIDELIHVVDLQRQKIDDAYLEKLISSYHNKKPIIIPQANTNLYKTHLDNNNLDWEIPQLTVPKITQIIGEDRPIEVMDVLTQNNSTNWNLGQWNDYFNKPLQDRDRIRNVISLEFSDTELSDMITIPKFVRDIDISNKLSMEHLLEEDRPKITKYCLMSVKDSYTDFHIDFGGTSVYYTVLHGHKSFIMYPPTLKNLQLYEAWSLSLDQNSIWFGDLVKPNQGEIDPYYDNNGIKISINPGDLLILPSGWIHAVYTSEDSLVIGGNFLTIYSIPTHLKIFDIEKQVKVPEKYKLPNFTKIMWLIGYYYLYNKDTLEIDLPSLQSLLDFYKLQIQGGKRYRSLIPSKKIGSVDKFMSEFEFWVDERVKEQESIKTEDDVKIKRRKL